MSTDFAPDGADKDEFHLSTEAVVHDGAAEETSPFAEIDHTSGTALRRRFVTPASIAALATAEKPSLLQRLLRRR